MNRLAQEKKVCALIPARLDSNGCAGSRGGAEQRCI